MTRPRSRDNRGPSDRTPDSRGGGRGPGRPGHSRPKAAPRTGPRPPAGTEQDLPDPSTGDARDRVQARLVRIAREYPDLPIGSVDVGGLSSRDAAFAKALEHVILHRWNTLQAIADSQVDRDWRILQGSIIYHHPAPRIHLEGASSAHQTYFPQVVATASTLTGHASSPESQTEVAEGF